MIQTKNEVGVQDMKYFHGTRAELAPGSKIEPTGGYCHFSPNLDAAIWAAELSPGDQPPRVYSVVARGTFEDAAATVGYVPQKNPEMTLRTPHALEVISEVTTWTHYHGTKASLTVGDLIQPGHPANFGATARTAKFVYFTRTLDASIWGAELALGEGPGRIYIVEPLGPIEDDPNLTNTRFRGNPTKSFRSQSPLRVVGEVGDWTGHPREVIAAMREGLARLERAGVPPNDE